MFHYRAQTFTKIASAIEAPFSETVFLVTYGRLSPLGNSNHYSKENCKARHSWKAAFYLNNFHSISIVHFLKLANPAPWINIDYLSIYLVRFLPQEGGVRVLPYMSYVGMCDPKW